METKLVKLKGEFNDIINIRSIVKNVFDILQTRINRLREIYSEFIKSNKSEMFVFGLDSFQFQSKLIDIEYDDMKRLFLAINNRMYCEYFKLHKIIIEYISKNINDKKILDLVKIDNFPIYKDLEPFKEYKFEIILDIHENILNLLGILVSILNNRENEFSVHKTKQNIGLNINNFITSFNFNINVMREKIMMFITYIEFFHNIHSKYLKRFSNKIQLMYTHISNDIKFDDSFEITNNKKKELIDEFSTNNMDKTLLKELKTSIGSETNSEVSDGSKSRTSTPSNKPLEKSDSLTSLAFASPEKKNEINRLDINKEKKDYKKIFQKNVHKVTDILQLCKPKKDTIIEPELTDKDIEQMFNGIEQYCNSVIDEKKELEQDDIKLYVNSFDTNDIKTYDEPIIIKEFISIDSHDDNKINIKILDKKPDIFIGESKLENESNYEEVKSKENYIIIEEKDIIKENENKFIQENEVLIVKEPKEEVNIEEVKKTNIIQSPEPIKKRIYKKKKK